MLLRARRKRVAEAVARRICGQGYRIEPVFHREPGGMLMATWDDENVGPLDLGERGR